MAEELRFTSGQAYHAPQTSPGHCVELRGAHPQPAEQIDAQGEEAQATKVQHVHDISRRQRVSRQQRVVDAMKRLVKPVAVATALALTVPAAVDADEAAALKRSHPVFKFRNQNQGDYGGRFPGQGCGPTSISMIGSTLKDDSSLTPPVIGRQLPDKYWPSGMYLSGFHYMAKKYGIDSKNSNLQEAKDVLWDGGLAAVHVKPGPWTSAGHYMVLKAVRSDGRFRIADPNNAPGRNTEKHWWSASELKRHGVDDVVTFMPSENMLSRPSDNILMHTEGMAARLAVGGVIAPAPVDAEPNHEFDLRG